MRKELSKPNTIEKVATSNDDINIIEQNIYVMFCGKRCIEVDEYEPKLNRSPSFPPSPFAEGLLLFLLMLCDVLK